MTEHTSPLRQRMIDDMTIRNMSPQTQKVYIHAVANFSAFHRRSPDKLAVEDVRTYRLHLIDRGLKATSINPIHGRPAFLLQHDARQNSFVAKVNTFGNPGFAGTASKAGGALAVFVVVSF